MQYSYDRRNRLTGIAYSGTATPNVGFSYDGANNRTQMTDGGSAAVNYVYDDLDRLTDVPRNEYRPLQLAAMRQTAPPATQMAAPTPCSR